MSNTVYVQDWMPQDNINSKSEELRDKKLYQFYKDIDKFIYGAKKDSKNAEEIEGSLIHFVKDNFEELVKPKTISDPIIGYIHFTALEMYIIDTPLFQRLRNIKQLGLANFVFPSVSYSRFEHSLGVLGRVEQLLNKIIENNTKRDPDDTIYKTIKKYKVAIRLAALLHDIGHCLFSHCSERVIDNLEESKYISKLFTQHFKKKIPFAEIFTISVIGNKNFLAYILKSELSGLGEKQLSDTLHNSVNFILGLPAQDSPDTVFLGQLISSGLDADKVDYMTREQHYSGIKLQIDLERILSKLQVFEIDFYQLPEQLMYLKEEYQPGEKFKILGFAKGGQFVFEEFCIARLALHIKIYLHQKIRLAESQLSQYLMQLSELEKLKNPVNWLYLSEDIIKYPKCILKSDNLFDGEIKEGVSKKLLKIHHRELYFRAFSFGLMNSRNTNNKNENIDYFDKYVEDNIDINLNVMFKQKISDEANRINILLDKNIKTIIPDDFIIELPRLINIQQGQESLYFERVSLSPVKWTIPIDKIMNYFQENRALGYVFSELDIASSLSLACEKIFLERYEDIFEQDSFISRNVYKNYIENKKELSKTGYYKEYPQLEILSDYLLTTNAVEKIEKIYQNLKYFKPYKKEGATINRITTFVNQFPQDLHEVTLNFLLHLKVYDTDLLGNKLIEVLPKDNKGIGLCNLGNKADSASLFGYTLRDDLKKYTVEELDEKLILKSDVLYIFDDNINSGKQLINILAELLNKKEQLPSNLKLENESHVAHFKNQAVRTKLLNMDLHFVYIVGYENIESEIKESLKRYLDFKPENIYIHLYETLKDNEKIFTGAESGFQYEKKNELKIFLKNVAKEVFINGNEKDESGIERYTLGYANAEAMVVFPYNVPTMTISALWCEGKLNNNIPWIPLVERRRRSKNSNN